MIKIALLKVRDFPHSIKVKKLIFDKKEMRIEWLLV